MITEIVALYESSLSTHRKLREQYRRGSRKAMLRDRGGTDCCEMSSVHILAIPVMKSNNLGLPVQNWAFQHSMFRRAGGSSHLTFRNL